MTQRRLTTLIGVSSFLLLWYQPSTRGQQARVRVTESLRAAAAQGGPVRVIVGVRVNGYQPEGNLTAVVAARQRADIQAASARVLARLPAAAGARARVFDVIPYFSAAIDANALLQLEGDPDVSTIEEDRLNVPTLAQSVPLIGGNEAWADGYTGSGWTVAILDTGVEESHSFLTGKTVAEGCYSNANNTGGGTSLCPGGVGSSTAPGSGLNCSTAMVSPNCFHGTHVAGIAAGKGASFSGVARDANIMAFQVFSNFGGGLGAYDSDVIAALNRVYALRASFKIASVNMSLGSGRLFADQASCDADNAALKAAIDALRSANIASVVASGNDEEGFYMSSPACISTAVSVGSTTKSDVVSSFSNAASFLSLLAPGGSVNSSVTGNSFSTASGTSMATPHVAGAWAVLKHRAPSATVNDVLDALRTTGVSILDSRNDLRFPRIRVDAALSTVMSLLQIDNPPNASSPAPTFGMWGWAIDRKATSGTGVSRVDVWATPSGGSPFFVGVASYGAARSDVAAAYGSQFTNSGYSILVSGLTPGLSYTLTAYGLSTVTGTFNVLKNVSITVPASRPGMALDRPGSGSGLGRTFIVSGWALDLAAPTGTGADTVHVWLFPTGGGAGIFLGASSYGQSRSDVGAAFGSRFTNSGFQLIASGVAPGNYTLTAYMHSTYTGTFNLSQSATNVTVLASNPLGNIEHPGDGVSVSRPFGMWGWAADTGATSGTGIDVIHVWAFPTNGDAPVFLGAASYGGSRPDVGSYLGSSQFNNSGWSLLVNSSNLPAPGTYDVYVYGRSTVTGDFSVIRIVRVTVG